MMFDCFIMSLDLKHNFTVLRIMFRSSTEKCLQCFRQLLKLDPSQKVHDSPYISHFHYITHQFYLTYFRNVTTCWKGPQARK